MPTPNPAPMTVADWIEAGTAASTRRAYTQDVKRFHTWCATHGHPDIWPISVETVVAYLLDHLPGGTASTLTPTTLRRYLASLSIAHGERGLPSPTRHPRVALLLRRAKQALAGTQVPAKKSPITFPILRRLLITCDESLYGIRDRAILWVGFASGGRQRDELVQLRISDCQKTAHGYRLHLRKSKTDQAGNGLCIPLEGEAAAALTTWLVRAGIREGRLFRSIRRNGRMNLKIIGKSINAMIKKRIEAIGLDPKDYGAHSLRAGFITSAIEAGMPLHEIVRFSGHRDRETAQGYVRTTRPLPATLHTLFSKEHIK